MQLNFGVGSTGERGSAERVSPASLTLNVLRDLHHLIKNSTSRYYVHKYSEVRMLRQDSLGGASFSRCTTSNTINPNVKLRRSTGLCLSRSGMRQAFRAFLAVTESLDGFRYALQATACEPVSATIQSWVFVVTRRLTQSLVNRELRLNSGTVRPL